MNLGHFNLNGNSRLNIYWERYFQFLAAGGRGEALRSAVLAKSLSPHDFFATLKFCIQSSQRMPYPATLSLLSGNERPPLGKKLLTTDL